MSLERKAKKIAEFLNKHDEWLIEAIADRVVEKLKAYEEAKKIAA